MNKIFLSLFLAPAPQKISSAQQNKFLAFRQLSQLPYLRMRCNYPVCSVSQVFYSELLVYTWNLDMLLAAGLRRANFLTKADEGIKNLDLWVVSETSSISFLTFHPDKRKKKVHAPLSCVLVRKTPCEAYKPQRKQIMWLFFPQLDSHHKLIRFSPPLLTE